MTFPSRNDPESILALLRPATNGTMTGTDGGEGPRIDDLEPVVTLHSGLYNGRLLTVLPYTSRAEQAEQCLRRLQDCGVQVPVEQCKDSLQIPALIPEVHRYIFFNSRGFIMILAMVLYASIWINLYSTAQMFANGQSWVTSIPVTITAVIVTIVVIFAINRHQKKINVNTDIRLAAANEIFMEYNVLLGISDRSRNCQSVPSLCFIYFHLWGCHRKLSQRLANMSGTCPLHSTQLTTASYCRSSPPWASKTSSYPGSPHTFQTAHSASPAPTLPPHPTLSLLESPKALF
ncbi:transmembrane protein 268 isoform X3 [Dendrobates tinctorius]|uniref:transmembrane protein 268 isoform X3 n=1 Tax=Dendrobates tinctorius TaxID=92724 RepID=UPI003CC93D3C